MRNKKIKFLLFLTFLFFLKTFELFFVNSWFLIVENGYVIPSESTVFTFKATKMNDGTGGWWLFGEDSNYYYDMNVDSSSALYFKKSKKDLSVSFDKYNYSTWDIRNKTIISD